MGSPLGSVLANAFLCLREGKWIRECPVAYALIFYKRYVNDIFVLIKSKKSLVLFKLQTSKYQIYMWNRKRYISSLLDVDVYRVIINSKHQYTVNQHFLEFILTIDPLLQLCSLITTLLYRGFTIVSDYHKLHEEVVKLKSVLN